MEEHILTIMPHRIVLKARAGDNLLQVLRRSGLAPDAPCGGNGKCGKCTVLINGEATLACRYTVSKDIDVVLPDAPTVEVLTVGTQNSTSANPAKGGFLAAFDIGTTTLVCFLLSPKGEQLAVESMQNPQIAFGADVISRIQLAINGELEALSTAVRSAMEAQLAKCCAAAGIDAQQIGTVCVVANPCMQQLFLGISPVNLATVPFAPVLKQAQIVPAAPYLPCCKNASLLIVPNISGFVGADTVAGVLATKLYKAKSTTLLVDIGTNGEMVLSHNTHMVACSTAAGPALEGANIRFGMRGCIGAIDHVWIENGKMQHSVIGNIPAKGICGSGIVDAVACMLELGLVNNRGRILCKEERDGQRFVPISENVYLTQEDIRQVQMAKGAISAGIHLMAQHMGISVEEIDVCLLAGAFGSFLNPDSACKIALLPPALKGKITAVGNTAGSGAKLLATDVAQLQLSQGLTQQIEHLELASLPSFQRTFAKNMAF